MARFDIIPFDKYGNETWVDAVNINQDRMSIDITRNDTKLSIIRKLVRVGRLKREIDPSEFILEWDSDTGVLMVFTHESDAARTMVVAELIQEGKDVPVEQKNRAETTNDRIDFSTLPSGREIKPRGRR